MTESIPDSASNTDASAREEFKKVASSLLFLAFYKPVITPAKWHYHIQMNKKHYN